MIEYAGSLVRPAVMDHMEKTLYDDMVGAGNKRMVRDWVGHTCGRMCGGNWQGLP